MDYRYGISAFFEGQRMRSQSMTAYQEGGITALKEQALRDLYNIGAKTSIIGSAVFFPGALTQISRLPRLIRGGMSFGQFLKTYGGNFSPFPSLGMVAARELYSQLKKSPRQDTMTSTSGVRVPKTRGGTISSRGSATAGPQTLKPFWSNGKPKCRKGYRYDFKHKMCVKKS